MRYPRSKEIIELDEKENIKVGINLYKIRCGKFLSQDKLAKKLQLTGLDMDRSTLSLLEHGKRKLLAYEIPYFAQALKMSTAEFIDKLFEKI